MLIAAMIVLSLAPTISLVDLTAATVQQTGAIANAQDATTTGVAFIFFDSKQLFGWATSSLKDKSE